MTAHELARQLLAGPDIPVTVRGYEDGVNIIEHVSAPMDLALKVHEEWYYGEHDYIRHESARENYEGKEIIQAIHLTS